MSAHPDTFGVAADTIFAYCDTSNFYGMTWVEPRIRIRLLDSWASPEPAWWATLPWPQIAMGIVLLVIVVALLRYRDEKYDAEAE